MTPAQFVTVVRNRNNALNDSNWSDDEIYALLTNRCNEALSYIGLIESTSTVTSTAGTETIAYPSYCATIENVEYTNKRLRKVDFGRWDIYKARGTSQPEGLPSMFTVWDEQIYLIPTPSSTGDAIKIWYQQYHPDITSSSTILIPPILHPHLVHGVLADMYAKDLNVQLMQIYEQKWMQSIDAFATYKAQDDMAGQFIYMGDSDTEGNGVW